MTSQMIVTWVAVLAPLVGVPLSVITFYLRALKEQQDSRARETAGRLQALEDRGRSLEMVVEDVQRDYTTKEEWLRESMLARQQLERLTEMVVRLEARMENGRQGDKVKRQATADKPDKEKRRQGATARPPVRVIVVVNKPEASARVVVVAVKARGVTTFCIKDVRTGKQRSSRLGRS